MMTTYLNKHFRFVYTPNRDLFISSPGWYLENIKSNRFLIGGGSLGKYIGERNADTVQKSALNSKTDKVTLKFRKYGKIEIYVK